MSAMVFVSIVVAFGAGVVIGAGSLVAFFVWDHRTMTAVSRRRQALYGMARRSDGDP